MKRRWWALGVLLLFGACGGESDGGGSGGASSGGGSSGTGGGSGAGGSGASSGSGGGAGAAGDAGDDVAPADGPFACGSKTCGATQFCIHPCCGGAPPACDPKPEGGSCPAGFHEGCSFGKTCGDPAGCCEMDPCTPPPPYCSDTKEAGCVLNGHDCYLACA